MSYDRTEKILQESGVSVAPPKRIRSATGSLVQGTSQVQRSSRVRAPQENGEFNITTHMYTIKHN